jgi:EAL domain-containing protein (putative c-di-GMP-specific phosphodiesterase class I)
VANQRELFLTEILNNRVIKHSESHLLRKDGSKWWGSTNAHLLKGVDVSHACALLAQHPIFFEQVNCVSINLSGPSLTNRNFLELILSIFKEAGVSPTTVCFEVTETVAVSNLDSAINFIRTLKEFGFRFALDDFGSGISSFGYLKNLLLDYLKIDGMFVKNIVEDPIDYAIVKSINEMGHLMGMQTIAKYVENDEVKVMLTAIGIDYGQGYGLGKSKPLKYLIAQRTA